LIWATGNEKSGNNNSGERRVKLSAGNWAMASGDTETRDRRKEKVRMINSYGRKTRLDLPTVAQASCLWQRTILPIFGKFNRVVHD